MRSGDRWILCAVLVLALGLLLGRTLLAQSGESVVVTTPTETHTLPLFEEATLTLTGRDGMTVVVTVADGTAGFAASECPDRLCVHTGRLHHAGATAACVPAGITLRITGVGEVDAVAG
jgi:hypothetical protein